MTRNVIALTTIPTNDCNFISALKKYATTEEIYEAAEIMRKSPQGNKSRICACERELRRREKEAAKNGAT